MKSELYQFAALLSEAIGSKVAVNEHKRSFRSKNVPKDGSQTRVAGVLQPDQSCRLTFEIATIRHDDFIQASIILQTVLDDEEGTYLHRSTPDGCTLYYRVHYDQPPLGVADSSILAKDVARIKEIRQKIQACLPVKVSQGDLDTLYRGLHPILLVRPYTEDLYDQVAEIYSEPISAICEVLLGHRVAILPIQSAYERNLVFGAIANKLDEWSQSLGWFSPIRYTLADILNIRDKVPFALGSDLKYFAFQHSTQEVSFFLDHVVEVGLPMVLAVGDDQLNEHSFENAVIIQPVETIVHPKTWIQYFVEHHHDPIMKGELQKILDVLLPAFALSPKEDLTPQIIRATLERFRHVRHHDDDPLPSMTAYLFQQIEN